MRLITRVVYVLALAAAPLTARAAVADANTATDANATDANTVTDGNHPGAWYFVGSWGCTGFGVDQKDGDRVPFVGTWHFNPWYEWITDTFEGYAGNGMHYAEWGWTRYDRDEQAFVRHAANTLGGHGKYEATGWEGDTWEWNGHAQGPGPYTSPVVETVTLKSPEHFWISVRFFDKEGKRRDLYKADCRRQFEPQRAD